MSMRPLAALGLAGMIMLVCASLSKADIPVSNAPVCIAKDQVIEKVLTDSGDGTHFRKVTGGGADMLRKDMEANGLTDLGTSYIVFWKDGETANAAVIAIFDEHNCFNRIVKGPRDAVLELTKDVGV